MAAPQQKRSEVGARRPWRPLGIAATLIALCAGASPIAATASACGEPAGLCKVPLGTYRLAMPPSADRPVPALMYLHGWGASAAGVMRDKARRATLVERGYALIAPQGLPRDGMPQNDWAVRDGGTPARDDLAFFRQVIDDAGKRGVDTRRVLLAGFSRGGSMVWDVACQAPRLAAAYAPVSGAFWEPLPKRCSGGAVLHHSHGWSDGVVPLEGRAVAEGRLTQGDVFAGLEILRRAFGCAARAPDETSRHRGPRRWVREWTTCADGTLRFVLHPGGHRAPRGWLSRTLDWFEASRAPGPGRP